MTQAFTDANGGYYQTDEAGVPLWAINMTPCPVQAPPEPVNMPLICTPFQIRAALTQQGLRAQAEAAITASTDQTIKDAWQYAQQFVENDKFITQMATALGKSQADIHALFQFAVTLAP